METVTLTLSDGEPLIVGLGWEVVFLGVERRERRRSGEREVEGWKGFRAAWIAVETKRMRIVQLHTNQDKLHTRFRGVSERVGAHC
jgi:hypothetical protein